MDQKNKNAFLILVVIAALCLIALALHNSSIAVLDPKGVIATKERNLIIVSTLLMLIVVIPVYILTFGIAWKYRASNKSAKYAPDWDRNRNLEVTWWAVPTVIILILSVITWNSSHDLDPFKPIASTKAPISIQVVSLQWKWLFIYPQQNIATVNYFQIPVGTPVNFHLTSDAPMNSFWVPQLSGQIYTMPGMTTQLNLEADQAGNYAGSSANISGRGFASMKFTAQAVNKADFEQWVQTVKQSSNNLSLGTYDHLAKPTVGSPVKYYSSVNPNLFDIVVNKFMQPGVEAQS